MTIEATDDDLLATGVLWDIEPILPDGAGPADLFDRADALAEALSSFRGRVAGLDAAGLAELMHAVGQIIELVERATNYSVLKYTTDTMAPANSATFAMAEERGAAVRTRLLFVELEWSMVDDDRAAVLLADPQLAFCAHYLANLRRMTPHRLSEAEEALLTQKRQTGTAGWARLYEEVTAAMSVELPAAVGGGAVSIDQALSRLDSPDREVRRQVAAAVTSALVPALPTQTFAFNMVLLDKSLDDRMRGYPTWVSSRNLANDTSDDSVQALIDAVVGAYWIPQRWYTLKAELLGVDRLADYDRYAPVASDDSRVGWSEATAIVRDAYWSFSPELGGVVDRFIDDRWIHAPAGPGKRGGAFCESVTASHHPYVMLNWASRTDDITVLAHELGHGVHGYLARQQGVFHQSGPLTVAETASVFGETLTSNRLLATIDDPDRRLALLVDALERSVGTVFRQVALNRFEHACHTLRREQGELSTEQFGDVWYETQAAMFGGTVDITDGYRSWWSYIPHYVAEPGYVYAYAYGQLLALSVYARYEAEGDSFVPAYLDMLRAGGSVSPEGLGAIVGCDLTDPNFWHDGLQIIAAQLTAAEQAAREAGRIR